MKYLHRVPLTHAKNFRDLGGYPTADGKVTKWGTLFRSDQLSYLTLDEWETLQERGIRTLIDLRSNSESSAEPIRAAYPVEYHLIPLMKAVDEESDNASSQFIRSMKLDYPEILFGNLPGMVEILDVILDSLSSGNGNIVFFCAAGKDRAGITAALLLYLCGVSREDIIADYMVSANYDGWTDLDSITASLPPDVAAMLPDDEELLNLYGSEPETMSSLLDLFDSKDIRKRLEDNGFSEEKQSRLVTLMTE